MDRLRGPSETPQAKLRDSVSLGTSQVYGNIDRLWLDRSGDIPDFIWATAALGAIKESGDLNCKAASWAAISAMGSFVAATASFW